MRYFEVTFKTTPCTETVNDVLSACLGEIGFESFIENTDGIKGYIQQPIYNEIH
jgi:[LSU ribosomal protein L11P]-lysine N-methyltransferase (EC 2.1.1.-)